MKSLFRTAAALILIFSVMLGVIYPGIVTAAAWIIWPQKAQGSAVEKEGIVVGSRLIGQSFTESKYFWGRPSSTPEYAYNATHSSGSNAAPSSAFFMSEVEARIELLRKKDPGNKKPVPVDLVTTSASGLDPYISPAAAVYQIPRVAKARNLSEKHLKALIERYTEERQFGLLGETGVNVLLLNLSLDGKP